MYIFQHRTSVVLIRSVKVTMKSRYIYFICSHNIGTGVRFIIGLYEYCEQNDNSWTLLSPQSADGIKRIICLVVSISHSSVFSRNHST